MLTHTTTRRLRSTAVVMLAALASLAMMATASFAQYTTDIDFGVVCTPENPQPGDTVTCQVSGAQPGEDLQATATAEVQGVLYEDAFAADGDGNAVFSFSTAGTQDGEAITVTVTGAQSGTASDSVEVDEDDEAVGDPIAADTRTDAAPSDDRLPVTGGQALLLSVVGVAMVGGGLLALRKRSTA
jgi:LPXTG-motif cell wall-anchored protein